MAKKKVKLEDIEIGHYYISKYTPYPKIKNKFIVFKIISKYDVLSPYIKGNKTQLNVIGCILNINNIFKAYDYEISIYFNQYVKGRRIYEISEEEFNNEMRIARL